MLTTRFEDVKISDNESFDSFYGRLNEIMIAKLNLGEKIKDLYPKSSGIRSQLLRRVKIWMR